MRKLINFWPTASSSSLHQEVGNFTKVAGGEEVVAAAIGTGVIVWSSQGKMEQVHSLNVQEFSCSKNSCEHQGAQSTEIRSVLVVNRSKVAVLVGQWSFMDRRGVQDGCRCALPCQENPLWD